MNRNDTSIVKMYCIRYRQFNSNSFIPLLKIKSVVD